MNLPKNMNDVGSTSPIIELFGSINGADLLKTHITGVINHGHGGFHTYVDVNEYPNLTINIILKTLKRTAQMHENTLPPVCYIQADNCARENKNRYVLAFCELLVAEKIFNEVHLSFLYVGNTHEDVDAAFSKISEKLRTTDAETLDGLIALLPKPEEILHMFDVKNWLAPHIADIEKHLEPLHIKFVKKNEEVQVFFKGQNIDPGCELNGNILTSIPNGQPTTIKPDHSHINIERQSKQIECLHSLFRKPGTVSKWERFFYSSANNWKNFRSKSTLVSRLFTKAVTECQL
ncbi:uncharacterized protein LOC128554598 [Mercenaria mercenaria]|uniref:uncharacterized protein LOC128554598 n=1 Tax=Mercenaria mercenaria TaxID=6596 RepID=UPI00234E7006|nr:uncharacterized protein LOC128554598 [Mercenaria mercenaria]